MINNWPNTIAHIDADAFFASCELARNPHLRGKPLMVLGKLDSCILAKSPEAKIAGVTTAMPVWDAKKLCPNGVFIQGDFRYYTLISRQMMAILCEWSPVVEVYSVDEAFVDMNGLRGMYRKSFDQIGDKIREQIKNDLGITVSVGVSVNKTLAKMGCEINKPDGTTIISGRKIDEFLAKIPVTDVPGIGYSRGELLKKYRVENCLHLAKMPQSFVQRLFGKMGVLLWRELRGEISFPILSDPPPPKNIGRTSSFEKPVSDLRMVEGLAFFHLERALNALYRHRMIASEITLHLRNKDFQIYGIPYQFSKPTADFFKIAKVLKSLINQIPSGHIWRSTGVILSKLSDGKSLQYDLFEGAEKALNSEKVDEAKAHINEKYGQFTVRSGSTLYLGGKCKKQSNRMGLI
ncbi:DNA polymerase IV [Candidatus Peregrinibacteria bacterium]|nr:DNA polymerase IV [Candidatus Peregrinibacteria bacterium]